MPTFDTIATVLLYTAVVCAVFLMLWDPAINYFWPEPEPIEVTDWKPYDQIAGLGLGQWAALISGYAFLPGYDDPMVRPWRDEFLRLREAVLSGELSFEEDHRIIGRLLDRITPGTSGTVSSGVTIWPPTMMLGRNGPLPYFRSAAPPAPND